MKEERETEKSLFTRFPVAREISLSLHFYRASEMGQLLLLAIPKRTEWDFICAGGVYEVVGKRKISFPIFALVQ